MTTLFAQRSWFEEHAEEEAAPDEAPAAEAAPEEAVPLITTRSLQTLDLEIRATLSPWPTHGQLDA